MSSRRHFSSPKVLVLVVLVLLPIFLDFANGAKSSRKSGRKLISRFDSKPSTLVLAYGSAENSQDEQELLEGVTAITSPNKTPLRLSVFGPQSTVIAAFEDALIKDRTPGGKGVGQSESPTVAVGRGKGANDGRVMVFGYIDFLNNLYDSGSLVKNGMNWLAKASKSGGGGSSSVRIGLYNPTKLFISEGLLDDGFKMTEIQEIESLGGSGASKYDIVAIPRIVDLNEEQLDIVSQYLKKGKGLMVGSPHDTVVVTQFKDKEGGNPANRLVGEYGIYWTSEWNFAYETRLKYPIHRDINGRTHIGFIWEKIKEQAIRGTKFGLRDSRLMQEYLQLATEGETLLMPRLVKEAEEIKPRVPTPEEPIDGDSKEVVNLLARLTGWQGNYGDVEAIKAHPASFGYPNLQWEDERYGPKVRSKTVTISPAAPATFKDKPAPTPEKFDPCVDLNAKKLNRTDPILLPPTIFFRQAGEVWYSTGMYAKAGDLITVDFPPDLDIKKYKVYVRIGVNREDLSVPSAYDTEPLIRWPKVDLQRRVTQHKGFKVASAFGGLVYIVLPSDYKGRDSTFSLTFSGSIEAPTYILGKTTKDEWREMMKNPGAPWGELISEGVVIHSLTSEDHLKKIKNPEVVLTMFNEGKEHFEYLGHLRLASATRYAPDRRLGTSWAAYAGYPIVTEWKWGAKLIDSRRFCWWDFGWGFWHEMGHNVEWEAMYITGRSEVINNIYPGYNAIQLCEESEESIVVRRYNNSNTLNDYQRWKDSGKDYKLWTTMPDVAFVPYMEIAQKYGWESIRRMNQFYNQLRQQSKNIPGLLEQKVDLQFVVLSKSVGENLESFFGHWNIPVGDGARECVERMGLPMSDLDPMKPPIPSNRKKTKN